MFSVEGVVEFLMSVHDRSLTFTTTDGPPVYAGTLASSGTIKRQADAVVKPRWRLIYEQNRYKNAKGVNYCMCIFCA